MGTRKEAIKWMEEHPFQDCVNDGITYYWNPELRQFTANNDVGWSTVYSDDPRYANKLKDLPEGDWYIPDDVCAHHWVNNNIISSDTREIVANWVCLKCKEEKIAIYEFSNFVE